MCFFPKLRAYIGSYTYILKTSLTKLSSAIVYVVYANRNVPESYLGRYMVSPVLYERTQYKSEAKK